MAIRRTADGQEAIVTANTVLAEAADDAVASRVLDSIASKDVSTALNAFGILVDQSLTLQQYSKSRVSAAAAAFYRALMQSSSDERYDDLLAWTMPTDERQSVRCFSVPVPVNAPPKAFARTMGQRPKDSTFPVASVAGTRGFFCSGWVLVQAADDIGRLNRLVSELQILVDNKVSGASTLLHLATAKSTRSDVTATAQVLSAMAPVQANKAKSKPGEPRSFTAEDYDAIAIACAASENDLLADRATAALLRLTRLSGPTRSFARVAHASATQNHLGKSSPDVLYQRDFAHWVSVTGNSASDCDRGQPNAMWLSHEGHLLHAAGGVEDALMLRYPLTGDFDWIVETQEGGDVGTDGGLVYGGLHFEASGRANRLNISDAGGDKSHEMYCPFVRHESTPTFNRMSIRSVEGVAALETNFHPMWKFDASAKSSPWLGLRSRGDCRPVFRNLQLTGQPEIPREISLIGREEMSGWSASFYSEKTAPVVATDPAAIAEPSTEQGVDWQVTDGVLSAMANGEVDGARPSLLRYERPLLDNETITYQFRHSTGNVVVHPAVGRLAFLMESGGIRVRWLTDHANDWTGLKSDHALLEPLSRRGPKPLPVIEDDWNTVSITRVGGFIDVSLNEKLVYHRKNDFEGDFRFGFYRDRRDPVQVRKATMTGNWPAKLPVDFLKTPFALTSNRTASATKRTAFKTIGATLLASKPQGFFFASQ